MFKFWRRAKNNKRQTGTLHTQAKTAGRDNTADRGKRIKPIKYELVASMLSDVGCLRDVNEDSGRYIKPGDAESLASKGLLAMVADGMGGHSAGEVASRIAIDTINRIYYEQQEPAPRALRKAFIEANRRIYEAALKDNQLRGMGTTCTALVLKNGSAFCAYVGDSRLYLVRDGQIYLMTQDHSAVMEMVKRGILSLEEARHHADRNVILRALGSQPLVEVSAWEEPFPVREGDQFLICSDGLYDLVEDEEIKRAVLASDPHTACESLVTLARERGGHDNITVGIVSLIPVGHVQSKQLRPTRQVEITQ